MEICKNCGHTLEKTGMVCPNCGYSPRHLNSGSPSQEWVLWILGFVLGFISIFIPPGLGPLILIAVYFSIREKHVMFARGLGYGLLTLGIVGLGAVALCFASFSGLGVR
jgi:hypothetical protein